MTFINKSSLLFVLSSLLIYLSLPNKIFHFGLLAWGALIPFLILQNRIKSKIGLFFTSWLLFFIIFITLLWTNPFAFPERFTSLTSMFFFGVFYIIYPFCYGGIVFLIYLLNQRFNPLLSSIMGATVWTLFEYIQVKLPMGFPLSIAISQYQYYFMIQIVSFAGIFGISFFIIFTNNFLYRKFSYNKKTHYLFASLGIIFYGLINWTLLDTSRVESTISFSLVQPNIAYDQAFYSYPGSALYKSTINQLIELSELSIKGAPVDILIWPELSSFDLTTKNTDFHKKINSLISNKQYLLTGTQVQDNGRVNF